MIDPRTPCVVGVAQTTWRDAPAPEPLEMWAEVARAAAADAHATGDVLARVDDLAVVHCQSWSYDDPPERLAEAVGISPARTGYSILAGTAHQRLLNAAAERMLLGQTDVALVAGGEALATKRWHARQGTKPMWSHAAAKADRIGIDVAEWFLPTELAHGIFPAWLTFALLDVARRARVGLGSDEQRRIEGDLMARASGVAARNPHAWFRSARTASEIITPSDDNRMIAGPYTKRMTAFMDVDTASATLMTTHAAADALGIAPERRVYLRSWAFARDETHVAARSELGGSPAMRVVHNAALRQAGLDVDALTSFDLYSCFPGAVLFACDALGIAPDDPRGLTVTGGLASFGGPSANYMGHSVASMVTALRGRANGPAHGLVTGIGMHMTKHVAAVYSNEAHDAVPPDDGALADAVAAEAGPAHDVAEHYEGPATIATAVAVHAKHDPPHVVAICDLPDGRRCYAHSNDPSLVDLCLGGDPVGANVRIKRSEERHVALPI